MERQCVVERSDLGERGVSVLARRGMGRLRERGVGRRQPGRPPVERKRRARGAAPDMSLSALSAAPRTTFGRGGSDGFVAHWDGTAWTVSQSATMRTIADIWFTSPNDVRAVDASGNILHWDGAAWSASNTQTTQDLHGVWGSAVDDVWAVGAGDTILHSDGTAWRSVTSGTTMATFNAVWGSGPNDVWAGGKTLGVNGRHRSLGRNGMSGTHFRAAPPTRSGQRVRRRLGRGWSYAERLRARAFRRGRLEPDRRRDGVRGSTAFGAADRVTLGRRKWGRHPALRRNRLERLTERMDRRPHGRLGQRGG